MSRCCMRAVSGVGLLDTTSLQAAFVAEDVTSIIKESIDVVLQNQQYNHCKVLVKKQSCGQTGCLRTILCAGWSVDLKLSGDLHQAFG